MAISQVVAAKVNGDLYNTVPPNAKASGAGGNGGSVAKASDSSLLDGVQTSYYNSGVFASTVLDNDHADKALTAGAFAYNNQKPVAKRVTTTISGVSNAVLESGAAQPVLIQSIHKIQVEGMGYAEGVRTTKFTQAIRDGYFNIYNGKYDAGYPQSSVDVLSLAPSYQDSAANPTRSIPGRLTYKGTSPNPVETNYQKKTG
jgi:hypothetical protein